MGNGKNKVESTAIVLIPIGGLILLAGGSHPLVIGGLFNTSLLDCTPNQTFRTLEGNPDDPSPCNAAHCGHAGGSIMLRR